MLKINKDLRRLGIVSVSALMLLGVGASAVGNTNTPVHADVSAKQGAEMGMQEGIPKFVKEQNEMRVRNAIRDAEEHPEDAKSDMVEVKVNDGDVYNHNSNDQRAMKAAVARAEGKKVAEPKSETVVKPRKRSQAPSAKNMKHVNNHKQATGGKVSPKKTTKRSHKIAKAHKHGKKSKRAVQKRSRRTYAKRRHSRHMKKYGIRKSTKSKRNKRSHHFKKYGRRNHARKHVAKKHHMKRTLKR